MPTVEQATLQDVNPKQRAKLKKLLDERAVLNYSFSYSKLTAVFRELGIDDPDDLNTILKGCVVATDDATAKTVKKPLDDKITEILSENNLTGVRESDPYGRRVDCLWYESKSVTYNKDRMIDAAPGLGISTKKAIELVEAGRMEKSYPCVTLRAVKEKE